MEKIASPDEKFRRLVIPFENPQRFQQFRLQTFRSLVREQLLLFRAFNLSQLLLSVYFSVC